MNIIINSRCNNNYLHDQYIKDADLFRGLKGAFDLTLGESLKLIRLLEYAPVEWNIDDRDTCKDKLVTYKRDVLIANSIKEKLRGNEYDEELYDYATKIDMEKLIRNKCSYCLKSSEEDKIKLIESYQSKFDIDVETEAILYLVKKNLECNVKVK